MVEAENGRGECGGGLLVDITAEEESASASVCWWEGEEGWLAGGCNSPLCPTLVRPG